MIPITRNHWSEIIFMTFENIVNSIVYIILGLKMIKEGAAFILLGFIFLYLMIIIIKWRYSFFYIEGSTIFVQNGIFKKIKKEIPIDKITTLDTKTNILNRLLNTSKLNINTGAINSLEDIEFSFTLKKDQIEVIKERISNSTKIICKQELKVNEDDIRYKSNLYKMEFKDIFLYTITKSKIYVILMVGFLYNILDDLVVIDKVNKYIDNHSKKLEYLYENISKSNIATLVFIIILFLTFIYIISTLICFIYNYVKYYNFTLQRIENNIFIEYGFFSKKSFSFNIEQINSIRFDQNLVCQLLNLYNINISVIGYQDDDIASQTLLYPLANKILKEEIIKNIVYELEIYGEKIKPPKHTVSMFLIKRYIISLIILLPVFYYVDIYLWIMCTILSIVLIIQTISGYRLYKNTSIKIGKGKIEISNGSIRKQTIIIPNEKIQSIGYKQSIFQRKNQVYDYNIDVCSNNIGDLIKLKNLDTKIINYLEEKAVV